MASIYSKYGNFILNDLYGMSIIKMLFWWYIIMSQIIQIFRTLAQIIQPRVWSLLVFLCFEAFFVSNLDVTIMVYRTYNGNFFVGFGN